MDTIALPSSTYKAGTRTVAHAVDDLCNLIGGGKAPPKGELTVRSSHNTAAVRQFLDFILRDTSWCNPMQRV